MSRIAAVIVAVLGLIVVKAVALLIEPDDPVSRVSMLAGSAYLLAMYLMMRDEKA